MAIEFQKGPFNQTKLTILNDEHLRLYGEPIEGNLPGRVPTLALLMNGNYPEFRVRLNNGKAGEDGTIRFNVDLMTTMMIITALEDAVRSTKPCCRIFDVRRSVWDRAANKPGEPYSYGVIAVGKNTDGLEYIGIQRGAPNSNKYAKINFFFTPADFHPLIDAETNQQVSRNETSSLVARGMIKVWTQLIALVNASTWDYASTAEGKRDLKREKSNGGNNNGGNGNYGGYNNNRGGYNNGGNNYNRSNNNGYNGGGNNYNRGNGSYNSQNNNQSYQSQSNAGSGFGGNSNDGFTAQNNDSQTPDTSFEDDINF